MSEKILDMMCLSLFY